MLLRSLAIHSLTILSTGRQRYRASACEGWHSCHKLHLNVRFQYKADIRRHSNCWNLQLIAQTKSKALSLVE